MFSIKSPIFETSLESLRPTQMTVGFEEVEAKRKSWAKLKSSERKTQMREELFPVVKGPKGLLYVLDHHHAALALIQEGADQVRAGMVRELQHLSREAFWTYLDHFSWMHAYDAKGRKCPSDEMPARFEDMKDDPFRSFSGKVRDAGGYAKPPEPFQEFLWANFFREQFSSKEIALDGAVDKAVKLARTDKAMHLPGWSGPK